MLHGNAFSLCVCLSVCSGLTIESLVLESSFWYAGTGTFSENI